MKILKSLWFSCIFALFLNLGVVYFLVQSTITSIQMSKIELMTPKPVENKDQFFWSYRTNEIETLAEDLFLEKLKIKEQNEKLSTFQSRIDAEKSEVIRLKEDIERMRQQLSKDLVIITEEEEKNLRFLVNTYSKLTPENIIPILGQMDMKMAAKILSLMKPDMVSAIFEQMLAKDDPLGNQARRVAELTELMRRKAILKNK